MRCVQNVKSNTSNVIVVGECGQTPPSIYCHINALSYLKRLQDLPDTKIVKQVFNELNRLHRCGVRTWVTKACELADKYGIDIDSSNQNFKKHCKLVISDWYKRNWSREVTYIHKHPILRTYSMIKQDFGLEAISDSRYRIATSKLRASSHILEIERGRYTKLKTDISKRLCLVCYTIEDEVHFLINCKLYEPERQRLFLMINEKKQNFQSLDDVEKFTFLLSNPDNQLIVWIGKFIYKCFQARSDFVLE